MWASENISIISVEVVCQIVLAVILYGLYFENPAHDRKIFWLKVLAVLSFFAQACDLVSWILDGNAQFSSLNYVVALLSYILGPFIAMFFCYFLTAIISEKGKVSRLLAHAPAVVVVVSEALFLLVKGPSSLFIMQNGFTHPGPMASATLGLSILVMCYAVALAIAHLRQLGRHDTIALCSYSVVPFCGVLLQLLFPNFEAAYPSLSISLMVVCTMMFAGQKERIMQEIEMVRIDSAKKNFEYMDRALKALLSNKTTDNLRPFLDLLRLRFDADNCALVRYDAERGRMYVDGRYDLGVGGKTDDGAEWSMSVDEYQDELNRLKAGKAVEFAGFDVYRLWRAYDVDEEEIAADSIQSIVSMPIEINGRLWGCVNLGHKERRRLTPFEFGNFRRMVEVIAIAIDRHDMYVDLKNAIARSEKAEKARLQ